MPAPRFQSDRVACVSTAHVTARDGELCHNEDAPGHLANLDDFTGHLFYVSADQSEQQDDLAEFGFSPEFRALFGSLNDQGFDYLRLDRDGPVVAGLPTFEW